LLGLPRKLEEQKLKKAREERSMSEQRRLNYRMALKDQIEVDKDKKKARAADYYGSKDEANIMGTSW
jgi:hypothetical protein